MSQALLVCQHKVLGSLQWKNATDKNISLINQKICTKYLSSDRILSLLNSRLNLVFESSIVELEAKLSRSINKKDSLGKLLDSPEFYHLSHKRYLVEKRIFGRIPASTNP
jgi:hypothetical protein